MQRTLRKDLLNLLESLPAGIDYDADPQDESPEDMTAHIAGLMWKRLNDETP